MVRPVGLWGQARKPPDIPHWTMVPLQSSSPGKAHKSCWPSSVFCMWLTKFPSLLNKWQERSWDKNINPVNEYYEEGRYSSSFPQNFRARLLGTDYKMDKHTVSTPRTTLTTGPTYASNIFLGAFYVFFI